VGRASKYYDERKKLMSIIIRKKIFLSNTIKFNKNIMNNLGNLLIICIVVIRFLFMSNYQ